MGEKLWMILDKRNDRRIGPYNKKDGEELAEQLNGFIEENSGIFTKPFVAKEIDDYIVTVSARSMSEMGASRYWELHVVAFDEEDALVQARKAIGMWSIYEVHLDILRDKSRAAPKGSIAYREI